jgi:hypothetical protein
MKKTSAMRCISQISLALSLFWLCGCMLDKPGAQLWFFVPENTPTTVIVDSAIGAGSFLDLRPDGHFTRWFGHFEYGIWTLKDQRLYLTNQQHKTFVYSVKQLSGKKLDLALSASETGNFLGFGRPGSNAQNDPFSLENNQWRVPPTHKEGDAEIRHRLYDHCRFWEAYFKWAKTEVAGRIDVRSTPTPLKIYGNGFGLKHYDNLPPEWKACFFDEEDCRKADTLIKRTFRRNTIKWPDTNDDLEKFISGFQQLQKFLQ